MRALIPGLILAPPSPFLLTPTLGLRGKGPLVHPTLQYMSAEFSGMQGPKRDFLS